MAYVQSHQSLGHHRKTLRMVDVLKCDRHKLIGHLHELFWWGLDNANAQGLLGHVAAVDIAGAAGWPAKDAQRFVNALLTCGGADHPGFLEESSQGYILHDWADYAGKLNDQRELRRESNRRAQQARRQRLRAPASALTPDDTSAAVSADCHPDSQHRQHPTGPDLTGPNRTGPDTPPLPPHDVSADALLTETNRRRSEPPPEPACCPNFAATGSVHWQYCPNAPAEVTA
jgi:hypothetical protein